MTKRQPATPIANVHAKTRNKPAKKEFAMYAPATGQFWHIPASYARYISENRNDKEPYLL